MSNCKEPSACKNACYCIHGCGDEAHEAATPATGHAERELLELAAKAAGVDVEYRDKSGFEGRINAPKAFYHRIGVKEWNPLYDDGDRYRLARACKLELDFDGSVVKAWLHGDDGWHVHKFPFTAGNDTEEAYVVLRAAAEIGKAMP